MTEKCDYHNWGHDQEILFLRGSLGVIFFFVIAIFHIDFLMFMEYANEIFFVN